MHRYLEVNFHMTCLHPWEKLAWQRFFNYNWVWCCNRLIFGINNIYENIYSNWLVELFQ